MGGYLGQPVVTAEEAFSADELLEVQGVFMGQPPSHEEEFAASEILEVSGRQLGIIGTVAAIGLKAALPSIQKIIGGSLSEESGAASRANRNASLNQLVGLLKIAEGLAKGTQELVKLVQEGNRVDVTQVQQADIAWRNARTAWNEHSGNFAALAGQEFPAGQVPAAEEVERLFLLLGQAIPAHEKIDFLFLRGEPAGMSGAELGRTRAQKTSARLGWLGMASAIFEGHMKKTNNNLNTVATAQGITRVSAQEAKTALAPPVAPPVVPPVVPVVPPVRPPAVPPVKPRIPTGLLIGGGVGLAALITVLALVVPKLLKPRLSGYNCGGYY